jgi:hypothetical protein
VLDLSGHPKATRADTDDPKQPTRHVTVLHIPPVTSAVMAVTAAILEEFKSGQSAAEEA